MSVPFLFRPSPVGSGRRKAGRPTVRRRRRRRKFWPMCVRLGDQSCKPDPPTPTLRTNALEYHGPVD